MKLRFVVVLAVLALAIVCAECVTAEAQGVHDLHPKAQRFLRLHSTAYCLPSGGSPMSNGRSTHDGAVAVMRGWPLGAWFQVRSGPFKGKILRAEDYIGYGSEFDIWRPSCSAARSYGRAGGPIKVAQISMRAASRAWRAQQSGRSYRDFLKKFIKKNR